MSYSMLEQQSLFLTSVKSIAERVEKPNLSAYVDAVEWAKGKGYATPEVMHTITSLSQLSDDIIPEQCVFKLANGWSGKGLMIIDREDGNRFFDHISLRSYGFYQLKEKLSSLYKATFDSIPMQWVIESREASPFAGTVAPISYSFYVINGQISLISQTDYNFATPRIAFFDGVFDPLQLGQHVTLNSSDYKAGYHVIPRCAAQFIKMAITLATQQGQPFVAVQLLATKRGPVFAGFDFAPRLVVRNALTFSAQLLQYFDDSMINLTNERSEADAFAKAIHGQSAEQLAAFTEIPEWKYERLAMVADMGEAHAAWRLSDKYKQLLEGATDDAEKVINQQLMTSWAAIRKLNKGL